MDDRTERKIAELSAHLEAHGYIVTMEPIDGEEDGFIEALRRAMRKVDEVVDLNSKTHGYRGLSANALRALHLTLPNPGWGIEISFRYLEVDKGPEI